VVVTSNVLGFTGGDLRIKHPLYSFFKYFSESMIVVSDWDLGGTRMIAHKFWWEFSLKELKKYNLKNKYGIYFTPCNMKQPRHLLSNFKSINSWYCDIDISSKDEIVTREEIEERKSRKLGEIYMLDSQYYSLDQDLYRPSFIIETRNGFHLYWLAWTDSDGSYAPSLGLFDYIEENIAKRLNGDFKAKKYVQLMRVPGFYNWKEEEGFACRVIPEFNYRQSDIFREYCEDEWIDLFGEKKEEEWKPKKYSELSPSIVSLKRGKKTKDIDIFEYVANMPQEKALAMLSGLPCVNGEVYTFKPTMGGRHLNIYINGKLASPFIDLEKNMIFCFRGTGYGSPNVIQWLKYYNPIFVKEPSLLAAELRRIYLPTENEK